MQHDQMTSVHQHANLAIGETDLEQLLERDHTPLLAS
jgi:hypothetical protein